MKRMLVLIIAAGLTAAPVFSQQKDVQNGRPFVITAGTGLYYNAMPLPSSALAIFAFLFNLRGEVYGGVHYRLHDLFLVGAEAGFAAITVDYSSTGGSSYILFDIPVRIIGSLDLSFITLQPYLGGLFLMSTYGSFTFSPAIEAGARILLGKMSGLYVEAGYALGSVSFTRCGIGYQMAL